MGRTDPDQRRKEAEERKAKRQPAPAKTRSKWSEEEQNKAEELYAQGGHDRTQFGKDLSEVLKGSKSPTQCAMKYSDLKSKEPKVFFVFDWDEGNPTKHSAELIAALPKADRNLGEPEIQRRWWAEVQGKGDAGATKFLSNALDHAFNYFGNGAYPKNTKEYVRILARSGLPPSFLDLKPPKRNTPVFRRACDQFLRETHGVRHTRDAALAQLAAAPVPCCWGFLLPGEGRSDSALQQELAKRAVLYACVGDGACPRTQMPKASEHALIKASTIMPPYEPVGPGATHATDPSYARQHCWMCLCLFILKGGRVFLEHKHLDANGAAQARALLTPTFVAGGCRVCNGGALRFGDVVRESLEKLSLEGGDVLKAALMAAEMFCAAAKEEYTTCADAFRSVLG